MKKVTLFKNILENELSVVHKDIFHIIGNSGMARMSSIVSVKRSLDDRARVEKLSRTVASVCVTRAVTQVLILSGNAAALSIAGRLLVAAWLFTKIR